MAIQSVAILGAGAVGSYFIWGLSDLLKDNLYIIAQGERKKKLETEGVIINHKKYKLNVCTPEEAQGVDLLIVTTKYGSLFEILDDIQTIVSDHTIVMSPLNGVDSEEIIAGRIGEKHMIYSLIKIASERKGKEIIFNEKITIGISFGEKNQQEPSARMMEIAELFSQTPLHYRMSRSIMQDIWYKFAFNVSWNLPQAILGCSTGAFAVSQHVQILRDCLRKEVTAVAAAKGIDIAELSDIEKMKCPSHPSSKYSTLQDLEAKRLTEIEMFSGTILRLGHQFGIPTPYNNFAYHAIHALEEKNEGKFDFS